MRTRGTHIILAGLTIVVVGCAQKTTETTTSSSVSSTCDSLAIVSNVESDMFGTSSVSINRIVNSPLSKVQIERGAITFSSFSNPASASLSDIAGRTTDTTDMVVPRGTSLVVIVDNVCLANNYNSEITWLSRAATKNLVGQGTLSYAFETPHDVSIEDLEAAAEKDPCVEIVGTNKVHHTLALPDDYSASTQAHLTNIKWDLAYDKFFVTSGGITQDIIIAIIDTGVKYTHEDLTANMWANPGETASNGIDDDSNGKVDDIMGWNFPGNNALVEPSSTTSAGKHGTHVAGLAAATHNNTKGGVGVMGARVKIMALNVFGESDGASTTDIDNAVRYAADKGAHVINMSIGGPFPSASTKSAIEYAITKGSFVVAAAGNDGKLLAGSDSLSPASYASSLSGMLSVGAIDTVTDTRSSYSNCSSTEVELGAPGSQNSTVSSSTGGLQSTLISTTSSYGRLSGTSMATPVVAGGVGLTIGLLKTKSQTATPAAVETLILANSRVINALKTYVKDGKVLDLQAIGTAIP